MIKIYHCNILQTTSLEAIAEDLLELRGVFKVHERVMFPKPSTYDGSLRLKLGQALSRLLTQSALVLRRG
jgi:hypothetical protein